MLQGAVLAVSRAITMSDITNSHAFGGYCTAKRMLELTFEKESRPSMRWVRQMTAERKIPFVKLGGKIMFDLAQVRAALQAQPTAKVR